MQICIGKLSKINGEVAIFAGRRKIRKFSREFKEKIEPDVKNDISNVFNSFYVFQSKRSGISQSWKTSNPKSSC